MLGKRLAVLVAAAMMMLSMFAASAPAFAAHGQEHVNAATGDIALPEAGEEGEGVCDPNPGASEASRGPHSTPSTLRFGKVVRDEHASEVDPSHGATGRLQITNDTCE